MAMTLLELFLNGLPSGSEKLNDERLKRLRNYVYEPDNLNAEAAAELTNKKSANNNLQSYKWFLTQIQAGKHPYEIFLNQLTNNTTQSSNPLKAYYGLLNGWKEKGGDAEAIKNFSIQAKAWKENIEKDPVLSQKRMADYFTKLSNTLVKNSNPFGLIPIFLSINDPEFMIAYMRWCLSQGNEPKEIINSGLLQAFFMVNATGIDLDSPESDHSAFKRLFAIMEKDAALESVFKLAEQTPANLVRGLNHLTLTGKSIAPGSAIATEIVGKPKLSLPDEYDANAYFELFGPSYIVELMCQFPPNDKALQSVLPNLNNKGLISCLQEAGTNVSNAAVKVISDHIRIADLHVMLEKKVWILGRLTKYQTLADNFFKELSPEAQSNLIIQVKDQPNDAYSLIIALYRFHQRNNQSANDEGVNEIQKQIFLAVLAKVLTDSGDESELTDFLQYIQGSFGDEINEQMHSYNQQLTYVENSVDEKGLTEDLVNRLRDTWSTALISYNRFKEVFPDKIAQDFPADKYAFLIRLLKLQQTKLGADQFDLNTTLQRLYHDKPLSDLTENEKSERQRLLVEFVSSITDSGTQRQIITQINALITSNQLNSNEALILGAKLNSQDLLNHIHLAELNQKTVEEAFILLVKAGQVEMVKNLLNLTENIQPSQTKVNEALSVADTWKQQAIIMALLEHKGANQLSQEKIGKYLVIVAVEAEPILEIIDKLLQHEPGPTSNYLGDALECVATLDKIEIIKKILTKVQQIPQKSIESSLIAAIQKGKIETTIELLNIAGDNKPSQAAVEVALRYAFQNNRLKDNSISKQTRDDMRQMLNQILTLNGDNKPRLVTLEECIDIELASPAPNKDILNGLLGQQFVQYDSSSMSASISTQKLDECIGKLATQLGENHKIVKIFERVKNTLDAGCSPEVVAVYFASKENDLNAFPSNQNRGRTSLFSFFSGASSSPKQIVENAKQAVRDLLPNVKSAQYNSTL